MVLQLIMVDKNLRSATGLAWPEHCQTRHLKWKAHYSPTAVNPHLLYRVQAWSALHLQQSWPV